MTFDEYWGDSRYLSKRPVRNGSRVMMVGDNIYHHDRDGAWVQADSHHSNPDGGVNPKNLDRDTKVDRVLISEAFTYFGAEAPRLPASVTKGLGNINVRSHRVWDAVTARPLLDWIDQVRSGGAERLRGDPMDFGRSDLRYDGVSKLVK